jgi:hypothetical protein
MKQGMLRVAIVLILSAAALAGSLQAPKLLRRLDAFAVQQVEVLGVRHLTAQAAVEAAGITAASNIFDDEAAWIEALLRHPLVLDADIERRLPGTVRLSIREAAPVALARTPELRAIDQRGLVLPVDPAADGLDLPVLRVASRISAEGRAADVQTRRIAAFLGDVARHEPGLLGWISEADVHGTAVRLVLRSGADADVLVPAEPTPERLRELHLTLADLATPRFTAAAAPGGDTTANARSAAPELSRVKRIDGRYQDQIVVALHRGKN